ncbi:MAG: hypothetical protein AAGI52_06965 [Bacteroidota bacterium]
MRALLLLPVLALLACSTPCERMNGFQADPAMQTCAFSGPIEDGASFALETGAILPAELLLPVGSREPQTLPDGTELVASYYGLSWSGTGGDLSQSDSLSGVESVTVGKETYALGMRTGGRVLVRSAEGETLRTVRVRDSVDRSLGIPRANAAQHLALAGGTLAIADRLGGVVTVDLETGAELWRSDAEIRALAGSPDGTRLAAATEEAVVVWSARTGEPVATWGGMDRLHGLAFSSDGAMLAAHAHAGTSTTSTRITTRDHNNQPTGVARSESVTTVGATPSVTVWRLPG